MRVDKNDIYDAVDNLVKGQIITYKLPETFGGEFAHIVLNDGKGKFAIILEKEEDGKPTGKKSVFLTTDSASFVAKWINSMWGERV